MSVCVCVCVCPDRCPNILKKCPKVPASWDNILCNLDIRTKPSRILGHSPGCVVYRV